MKDINAVWLLLASLNKLTKEKNELMIKISQFLASQNTVIKEMNSVIKFDQFQVYINNYRFLSVPWKRIFSSATSELKLWKIEGKPSL